MERIATVGRVPALVRTMAAWLFGYELISAFTVARLPMKWLVLVFLAFSSLNAQAHGGGLDAKGCHTRRATGEYHCHRAQVLPSNIGNQSSQTVVTDPTCHVGPRGGRYRIINGRKRYGC